MAEQRLTLAIRVADPARQPEQLDMETDDLRQDLTQLRVDVADAPGADVPPGSRGAELLTVGALVVTLVRSPELLRAILSIVDTWMAGRQRATATIVVDGDELQLSGVRSRQQQQLIDAFVQRHSEATTDGPRTS